MHRCGSMEEYVLSVYNGLGSTPSTNRVGMFWCCPALMSMWLELGLIHHGMPHAILSEHHAAEMHEDGEFRTLERHLSITLPEVGSGFSLPAPSCS